MSSENETENRAETQDQPGTANNSKKPKLTVEKSAAAYRTISEVASSLNLPSHVLRFWETKFSQISPMKRSGGRRYYRPEDVEVIARIQDLLHNQGYTIKGVQQLLADEKKQQHQNVATTHNTSTPQDVIDDLKNIRQNLLEAKQTLQESYQEKN